MNVQDFTDIIYTKDDNGIVTVTLNIPKRKNALSPYTFLELWWAVDAMEKDDTAKAMILTGAKDPNSSDPTKEFFSSGGYFNPAAIASLSEETKAEINFTDIAQKKLTLKFWQFDKPVIAAVNGPAIGGAFTMCLSCADLIFFSEHAWMSLPFVSLGLVPEFASSYLIPRFLGLQRAKEIMFFGERVSAQELLRSGMINKVLTHDQLLPIARETIMRLLPPQAAGWAVRQCKRSLNNLLVEAAAKALDCENKGLIKAVTTFDFTEAMVARMEKRLPVFKGI
jgi:2-(1,2-epoxy-1,2-dihydrophenyl)acetyl-CoA isomerase